MLREVRLYKWVRRLWCKRRSELQRSRHQVNNSRRAGFHLHLDLPPELQWLAAQDHDQQRRMVPSQSDRSIKLIGACHWEQNERIPKYYSGHAVQLEEKGTQRGRLQGHCWSRSQGTWCREQQDWKTKSGNSAYTGYNRLSIKYRRAIKYSDKSRGRSCSRWHQNWENHLVADWFLCVIRFYSKRYCVILKSIGNVRNQRWVRVFIIWRYQ